MYASAVNIVLGACAIILLRGRSMACHVSCLQLVLGTEICVSFRIDMRKADQLHRLEDIDSSTVSAQSRSSLVVVQLANALLIWSSNQEISLSDKPVYVPTYFFCGQVQV